MNVRAKSVDVTRDLNTDGSSNEGPVDGAPADDVASEQSSSEPPSALRERIANKIAELFGHVPSSDEPKAANPKERAEAITRSAARRASAVSAALSLPGGVIGMVTVLPDVALVWSIQAQMVADLAAAFGKSSELTREHLLYCLFKNAAGDSLRDIVTRVGERYVVQRTTSRAWRAAALRLGARLARESVQRTVTRFLPLIGAAGVAMYAYRDTRSVAANAIELFGRETLETTD